LCGFPTIFPLSRTFLVATERKQGFSPVIYHLPRPECGLSRKNTVPVEGNVLR
jgi:hypothetical protein